MEILRVTLAAGERKSFHKSGRYFEVMRASAPFDVHFTDRAIGVYPCIGLEAGVYSEMPFQMLEVVSSQAQTITLMISDHRAGFRDSLGSQEGPGLMVTGVNPVAAGGAFGGWVSGSVSTLADGAFVTCVFDLGPQWQKLSLLQISVFAGVANGKIYVEPTFGSVPGYDAKLRGAHAFSASPSVAANNIVSADAVAFTVRPMQRYCSSFAMNQTGGGVALAPTAQIAIKGYL
jgi:hypothetical protein